MQGSARPRGSLPWAIQSLSSSNEQSRFPLRCILKMLEDKCMKHIVCYGLGLKYCAGVLCVVVCWLHQLEAPPSVCSWFNLPDGLWVDAAPAHS